MRQPPVVYSQGQLKRILVVDDNSDVAFTMRLGLENGDTTMQVYSYEYPVKALAAFDPNFYDLLST
jgi:CheY-like chemotaxis protein